MEPRLELGGRDLGGGRQRSMAEPSLATCFRDRKGSRSPKCTPPTSVLGMHANMACSPCASDVVQFPHHRWTAKQSRGTYCCQKAQSVSFSFLTKSVHFHRFNIGLLWVLISAIKIMVSFRVWRFCFWEARKQAPNAYPFLANLIICTGWSE